MKIFDKIIFEIFNGYKPKNIEIYYFRYYTLKIIPKKKMEKKFQKKKWKKSLKI